MFQEQQAVGALPLRIAIRKVCPNIPEPRRTQQRIANRMRQHVAIRVPRRPLIERQRNPPNDEGPARFQPVQVVTYASTRGCMPAQGGTPVSLHLPHQKETETNEKYQRSSI